MHWQVMPTAHWQPEAGRPQSGTGERPQAGGPLPGSTRTGRSGQVRSGLGPPRPGGGQVTARGEVRYILLTGTEI